MRRQSLELQIKKRIRLLRQDQTHFLSKQYPELTKEIQTWLLDPTVPSNDLALSHYNFADKSVKASESDHQLDDDRLQVADEVFGDTVDELGLNEEARGNADQITREQRIKAKHQVAES